MSGNKARGITLVELMVVVAVLVILASVAYPLYTSQAQSARRADAKASLELIALAQERFYTANGNYTVTLGDLYINGSSLSATSDGGYYSLSLANGGDTQTFTATASGTGAQASDSGCATFTLNQLGTQGFSGTASKCW